MFVDGDLTPGYFVLIPFLTGFLISYMLRTRMK